MLFSLRVPCLFSNPAHENPESNLRRPTYTQQRLTISSTIIVCWVFLQPSPVCRFGLCSGARIHTTFFAGVFCPECGTESAVCCRVILCQHPTLQYVVHPLITFSFLTLTSTSTLTPIFVLTLNSIGAGGRKPAGRCLHLPRRRGPPKDPSRDRE